MLKNAIRLGIRQYFAIPVLKLHDKHCVGVLEFASAEPYVSYFIPGLIELYDNAGLGQMETALDVICTIHSLLFAQIWILDPNHATSINALISAGTKSYDSSSTVYGDFADASSFSYIQTGKGVVGRAFSSQGSCFCKDVTLLSLTEYPLVPTARKARLTQCFAICLENTRADKLVYGVEYFLPLRGMVDRDVEIFLNMILSTVREPLPGVTVASGKELGQRMLVEVLNVSPCDELDSFEIGQPLPIFQSLQERGETTEIYSLCQRSNIHDWEDNLSTGLLRPTEAAIRNGGRVDVDEAHDHIEIEKDTSEVMQLESHFEQENVETDSTCSASSNDKVEHSDIARCGRQSVEAESINGESNWVSRETTNIQRIDSQKNSSKQRILKDYGITLEILEEHFGMCPQDAAKSLRVSVPTFKRICREYNISRWPHHKTRKVYPHASQGVSLHGVEPYEGDQQCPNLSQEKGTDRSCGSLMTVKVTYRYDIFKFKLTPSSSKVKLEGIVEKQLNISLQKFSVKYQDKDDDWVTITEDADLREGMHELRLLGRTIMKLLVTPKSDT
ncbi:protein NLP6 [Capsicum chacoense]